MARNISENFGRIYVKELIVDQDGKIEIIGSNNVTISNDVSNIILPETLSGSITGSVASFNQLTASYILNSVLNTTNLSSSNINSTNITSSYVSLINLTASNKIIALYITGTYISGNGYNIWGIQANNIDGLSNAVKNNLNAGDGINLTPGPGNKTTISIDPDWQYITINGTNVYLGQSILVGTITKVTGNNGISGSAESGTATLSIDKNYVVTISDNQNISGSKTFLSEVTASSGISSSYIISNIITGSVVTGNILNYQSITCSNISINNSINLGTNASTSSVLNISGSISYNLLSTGSTNIYLNNTHNVIYATSELTCTLPPAIISPGRMYVFKKTYNNNMLITCSNSDIIENFSGSISLDNSTFNQSLTLMSDGINNWIVLNYNALSASNDAGINRLYTYGL